MNNEKYKKVWVVYIVLFIIFSILLYKSVHIVPDGSKAVIYPNTKNFFDNIHRLGSINNPGLIVTIPFLQKVRLYTEMTSGEIEAYKPELIIVYSYVINQSHIREFHAFGMADHELIKFYLSTKINKLIDNKSSKDDVLLAATNVFHEFTLIDSKNKLIEPFFKEYTIDVKARY